MISTAIDSNTIARGVGIKTGFNNQNGLQPSILPQHVGVIGQGSSAVAYTTTKTVVSNSAAVGEAYGYGSPLHLAVQKLLPTNGDGLPSSVKITVFPLQDNGGGATATGSIVPSGVSTASGSYYAVIGGIRTADFVITLAASVADMTLALTTAINASVDMPVLAVDSGTSVDLTAKWEGVTANAINIALTGPTVGVTFAVTSMNGGLLDSDISVALSQVGNDWVTMIVNCTEMSSANLDTYQTWGDLRWGSLVKKPAVVFHTITETDQALIPAVSTPRNLDKVNAIVSVPGSSDMPLVLTARVVARVAAMAHINPAHDYIKLPLDQIAAGTDAVQLDTLQSDALLKLGTGTTDAVNGRAYLSDTITCYRGLPGDPLPAFRYVTDIVKLSQMIYRLDAVFNNVSWAGAPLIEDNQPTTNASARKPKHAIAAVNSIIEQLGLEAVLVNIENDKKLTVAGINPGNPKRLDLNVKVTLSGNTNQISIDLGFSFLLGTPEVFV